MKRNYFTEFSKNMKAILFIVLLFYVVKNSIISPYPFLPSLLMALYVPICVFLIWYSTRHILLSRLANASKSFYFLIATLALFAIFFLIIKLSLNFIFESFNLNKYYLSEKRSSLINVSLLTYAVCNFIYFRGKEKESFIEQEKMKMIILKSQINSHFLFNALNDIYSMTYFDSKKSSDYVMKLSQMLRYVLEDCEAEKVLLTKEIKYIENFIDFQKSKDEDENQNISFKHNISDTSNVYIAPMIFQPIVENCFKHCSLTSNMEFIQIELIATDNQLFFSAENSKSKSRMNLHSEPRGIGLKNLKKRLEMNYPDDYKITISENDETYKVELLINLFNR